MACDLCGKEHTAEEDLQLVWTDAVAKSLCDVFVFSASQVIVAGVDPKVILGGILAFTVNAVRVMYAMDQEPVPVDEICRFLREHWTDGGEPFDFEAFERAMSQEDAPEDGRARETADPAEGSETPR